MDFEHPFSGIISDFNGRKAYYEHDWVSALCSGFRILAPTTYIFFASVLPVIAFGEQWLSEHGRNVGFDGYFRDHSLHYQWAAYVDSRCCRANHYNVHLPVRFSRERPELGKELYLAWTSWVCIWTAMMLVLLAVFNVATIINRFTRIAGELFGMLITVLFLQEAIRGVVSEFNVSEGENPKKEKYQFQWLYTNGLLAIIFSFGVLITSLKTRKARSWRYGTGWFRGFIADYGVPLMVVCWTALSFAIPRKVVSGVPRRFFCHFFGNDMGRVPVLYIFSAIIPALMIAGIYFFDHIIASQMAQQKEFNLKKPSASHYDALILGITTLICGFLGLPPSNGVLPQSPMHTKSLAALKKQMIRRKMVKSVKEGMKQQASQSEIYERMEAVFIELDASPSAIDKDLKNLKEAMMKDNDGKNGKEKFDPEKYIDAYLPVRVNEQPVAPPRLPALGKDIAALHHSQQALQSPGNCSCIIPVVGEPSTGGEDTDDDFHDAEVLNEMTTSRGELKLRSRSYKEERIYQVHPENPRTG
ncbi:Detected protein of confused Function [Hibiscus syriacus]|uniref:Detected protein of confused Function n=1 Tax=Hibiscus syriacus TaxID=106335 RepID=A0A6A2ZH74_HIBSY|nr:Detected protein of confused Function [Hibiscus syriacus]